MTLPSSSPKVPGRVGARHVRGHGAAGDGHAVAVGRGGLDGPADVGARLVVALVGAEDEQRVGRGDAVGGQALEERAERLVVVLRLGDVAGAAAAERVARVVAGLALARQARDELVAVQVGDVAVDHRDAGLQHVGHVGQRLRGVDGAEAGEARVVGAGTRRRSRCRSGRPGCPAALVTWYPLRVRLAVPAPSCGATYLWPNSAWKPL